jgi:hypothetical protein
MALSIDRIGDLSSKTTIVGWLGGLAWLALFTENAVGVVWWEWLILVIVGMFAASIVIGGGLAMLAAFLTRLVIGKSDGSPHAFVFTAIVSPLLSLYATGPAVGFFICDRTCRRLLCF